MQVSQIGYNECVVFYYRILLTVSMGCSDSKATNVAAPSAHSQPRHDSVPASAATPLQNGSRFQTVVIGGGMAGVAAAVELAKSGQKVAILEANSFIGGRLKTTQINLSSGGAFQFDEGASWIHGSCKSHPITKLSNSVNGVVMKQTVDEKTEVYDEEGENVQDQVDKAWKTYQKLLQKCQEQEPQNALESVFRKFGGEGILNDKYFMYHVSNDMEFQTSGSIAKLSGNPYDDDEFEGKEMLILSGYQRFAETLLQQQDIQVYLNQKIKRVTWKQGENQILSSNGITVYGKNVVIAVPIGVLKNKSIQFVPPLPDWKTQAIQSIGFGNVCKILIDFPNKDFIESKEHYIGVVTDNTNERGLCTFFMNLQVLGGIPAYMTFGLGQNADQAEKMSEADLKELIAKRMSAFSEEKISPDDFKITRTAWGGNQNFLGTYAYACTKTRPKHWLMMAKPVFSSNWYFCGEHTISKFRGSVHGAYLSGVDAAKSIKSKVGQGQWTYSGFVDKNKKQQSQSSESN